MPPRSHAIWVIVVSFLVACLLAIMPLPAWAMNYRPEWVPLVLIYWIMALPHRVGIGSAWLAGIMLDVLEGVMLGLNALGLVLIAYMTLSLHQRLRMFSALQQAGMVLALTGINLVLGHWLQIISGRTVASPLWFLLAALTSAMIWPYLFRLLRYLRRKLVVY